MKVPLNLDDHFSGKSQSFSLSNDDIKESSSFRILVMQKLIYFFNCAIFGEENVNNKSHQDVIWRSYGSHHESIDALIIFGFGILDDILYNNVIFEQLHCLSHVVLANGIENLLLGALTERIQSKSLQDMRHTRVICYQVEWRTWCIEHL